jgi:adenine-specific DNA-methyltransferase
MAKRSNKSNATELGTEAVAAYQYKGSKRKNNPPAALASEGTVPVMPKVQYGYSPRRPPSLRFDPTGMADKLPALIADAGSRPLTKEEQAMLAEALRIQQPWLEWANKQEENRRGYVEVDPVALNIHERVSAKAIVGIAKREEPQRGLFADPEQEYDKAVEFYRHDIDWSNRLILGDSLQVMSSLARREDLAGKVQMIYMDPPYGIKFASNFQPEVRNKSVKEKQEDLTREPEMVKAYRDTWHLGIHSYLSYLRDRLVVSKELLADTGSIFVQISDENVHSVRALLDEVFGSKNFCGEIAYVKTSGLTKKFLPNQFDILLWYARDSERALYHPIYKEKSAALGTADNYGWIEIDGMRRGLSKAEKDTNSIPEGASVYKPDNITSTPNPLIPFEFDGREYSQRWKTNVLGLTRLGKSERLHKAENSLQYVRRLEDFPAIPVTKLWDDTSTGNFTDEKLYVVQSGTKAVARCIQMTTNPGDLVLDPTCGSGTTAYVAEQWGRRWITIDTSRVAIAIARQRLLTAKHEYYKTKSSLDQANGNPGTGFVYTSVSHITLKSIAQNQNLDPIFEKHQPILEAALAACNDALGQIEKGLSQKLELKLFSKQKAEGKKSVNEADRRRWLLPPLNRDRSPDAKTKAKVDLDSKNWYYWEVPFDTDPDWPAELQASVVAFRKAWRAKMDEVNTAIAANAVQEELVDQPDKDNNKIRVSGPFTVEGVQPPEMSLGEIMNQPPQPRFDGAPEQLEGEFAIRPVELREDFEVKNLDAYLDQMSRLLRLDGVRFPNNKTSKFSRLDRNTEPAKAVHAEGRWANESEVDPDPQGIATVGVFFGPQYGPVTQKMIEEIIKPAARVYDDLVIAAFSFDAEAQSLIDKKPHPKLRIHRAHIRPDVNPGMAGLLKEQPGSQLFTVFGQPRTKLKGPDNDGCYRVVMEGVDIYDPVTNSISDTKDSKVAAWFLDSDYDGRTFCITQAFFPDSSAWEKLANALGQKGVVDADVFEKFGGAECTESLPFKSGKHRRVAVKVIDPRGNEVMAIHDVH